MTRDISEGALAEQLLNTFPCLSFKDVSAFVRDLWAVRAIPELRTENSATMPVSIRGETLKVRAYVEEAAE